MEGFAYGVGHQPQPNHRANRPMTVPYYGYGFYYNPGVQSIEGVTRQYGIFNGVGVSGNVISEPSWQAHHQVYYHRPYGSNNNNNGSTGRVPMGPNTYYPNRGTQTIQGDVVQRGNFTGRGLGARFLGHFSVSGDIN